MLYLYVIDNDMSTEYERRSIGKSELILRTNLLGRSFIYPKDDLICRGVRERCTDETQTISEDGRKIVERRTRDGKIEERIYLREN